MMANKPAHATADRAAVITRMVNDGHTAPEIAAALGVKPHGLRRWARNHGHTHLLDQATKRRRHDPAQTAANKHAWQTANRHEIDYLANEVRHLAGLGESPAQIAAALKRKPVTLERYFIRADIPDLAAVFAGEVHRQRQWEETLTR